MNKVTVMHSKGWAHLDLKLENILIDDNFDLKLTDMGFCLHVDGDNHKPKMDDS